ncbi:UvrD-helicase domain-containing protein [bacterium]|nr:UvrD-helicase domain-containing protein [bacterium]NCQ55313.1 UvrD-helicase domain-containing protein [Candidatus Parcubacteria bacterium]NCS67174.1 UvrD-helicase domain-containing protein [Candidatus Peregrinibacteria bacterium]NCS96800.1 UvrD-helicase domain-containing protein [bacterium]
MQDNSNLLSGLNEPQRQAVETLSGPLLVLAGAGSGKTKVLTSRIANLMAHGTAADNILAVTFTNKAAKEMQARVEKLIPAGRAPSIGTFHSICVRILRRDIEHLGQGYTRSFVIFDTDDCLSLLKNIMRDRHYDIKEYKPKAILNHFSAIKSSLNSPQAHFEAIGMGSNKFSDAVAELYPVHQRRLIEHNAVDFDDLITKVVKLWEDEDNNTLKYYQQRWQQVLVDEYQDTNFAQYRLIRLLCDGHQNLCVVGDDHQSIYSFRGADYRNILDFERDFPTAVTVKLEQNYRSSANILNNANKLIGHNQTGHAKNLWTEQSPGEMVQVYGVFDEKDEGRFVGDTIKKLIDSGDYTAADMAILYRMNAQSRAIEEALMRHQIPYQIVGGTRFFDRREVKDIMAYLRLIFNPRDDIAFLRIINVPSRKLGAATLEVIKKYANEYNLSLFDILEEVDGLEELPHAKRAVLKEFYNTISKLRAAKDTRLISLLLEDLIEATQFLKWLDDGTMEGESRQQNVKELFSVAGRYDTAEDPLAAFLEGVALISDLDNVDDGQSSVTLMTVHASKGLEFPVVFLPGWEEGIFPSSSSQFDGEQLEEERRLGYVAITRAEERCYISYARQRLLFGQTQYAAPSKFLSELDEECSEHNQYEGDSGSRFVSQRSNKPNFSHSLLHPTPGANNVDDSNTFRGQPLGKVPGSRTEAVFGVAENQTQYKTGDTIRHAEWGEGTIILIAGDVISAAFKGMGIKKIVASVAPIEKVEEA